MLQLKTAAMSPMNISDNNSFCGTRGVMINFPVSLFVTFAFCIKYHVLILKDGNQILILGILFLSITFDIYRKHARGNESTT